MKNMSCLSVPALALSLLAAPAARAQNTLTVPEASQAATVTQRIGLTDVTISYHSPLAKGRKVWGELVPYNEVWRAGANQNTTIRFTHDVTVEGQPLKAGTYGLHMIPAEAECTIIFSKNSTSWGSFFYKPEEDALRVKVKPQPAEAQDWLSYEFADRQPASAVVQLHWDKQKVPFKVGVDVDKIVLENMRQELRGPQGFSWQAFQQAANYALTHNGDLAEATAWIDKSLSMNETFSNLRVKSAILAKQGKTKEAEALMAKAMPLADEPQLNAYGYMLLAQNKLPDAISIFKQNVKKYPNSWNVYDSLAEGYEKQGDKKLAVENYKLALAKAPEEQKGRIEKTIRNLGAK